MWRDPMDELIEDLERIVLPERTPIHGSEWGPIEERQLRIQRILAEAEEERPRNRVSCEPDDEAARASPDLRFPGRDDEPPTPKS